MLGLPKDAANRGADDIAARSITKQVVNRCCFGPGRGRVHFTGKNVPATRPPVHVDGPLERIGQAAAEISRIGTQNVHRSRTVDLESR